MEKRPFFQAAMAGLGKYRMVGYGRIGVYRVKVEIIIIQGSDFITFSVFIL